MEKRSKVFIKALICMLQLSLFLIIHPLPEIAKAELQFSINILSSPANYFTGKRLQDLLAKHNVKAQLQETVLSEMRELVGKEQLSERDFLLLSFSDLSREPLLAKMTQAIAPADTSYVHIVTLSKHGIKEIVDLKGKRVSLGPEKEETEMNAEDALKAVGLKRNRDLTCENNEYFAQADKLINEEIEAFFITAPQCTSTVMKVDSERDIDLGAIQALVVEKMNQKGRVPYQPDEINLSACRGIRKKKKVPTAATFLIFNATGKTSSSAVKRVGEVLLTYPLFGRDPLPEALRRVRPMIPFRSEMIPSVDKIMRE